ncbi:UNVERIFIED_CONTAM: hypothetical protein K2H54_062546 [Gekko kuhli]
MVSYRMLIGLVLFQITQKPRSYVDVFQEVSVTFCRRKEYTQNKDCCQYMAFFVFITEWLSPSFPSQVIASHSKANSALVSFFFLAFSIFHFHLSSFMDLKAAYIGFMGLHRQSSTQVLITPRLD